MINYQTAFNGPGTGGDCHPSTWVGISVTVSGYVTAVRSSGFYMQDSLTSTPYSGIYVYMGSSMGSSGPTIGNSVSVTATVAEYYGLTQLQTVTGFNVVSSAPVTFTPLVVTPANIGTAWYASQRARSSDH